ncbi:MAG: nucleotidyl transferase AbiEii/AbiGii toxin family protein [Fibrobacterota bacterium]
MNSAVESMLAKYTGKTMEDRKNALKEIIQEIALCGLFRAGFFDKAAFYGGTALRIIHGLPRFSEDIDFSLLRKDADFDLGRYCTGVRNELAAFGFDLAVAKKKKRGESAIQSAFIKGGTLVHLLKINAVKPPVAGVHRNEVLSIKFEIDTDPPAGAGYEIKYLLAPIPYSVRVFAIGSLFAGKLHAVLCRNWGSGRIKGRDLYDYVWFLSQKGPVNGTHLEARMRQTGHWQEQASLTADTLISLLEKRFRSINYTLAKRDILPYLRNSAELSLWSPDFFIGITKDGLKFE